MLSQPAINVYGFGISTQSPDSPSYDLCITNPDGTQQCNTHPFDPAESDIAPRAVPTFAASTSTLASSEGISERWPWLLTAALLVLGAEWLVFARRG